MAGVRTPSPITMQVPSMTTIRRTVCRFLCFSRKALTLGFRLVSGGLSSLYVETSSSASCRLGSKLTFACRQISEYRTKVPPAKPAKVSPTMGRSKRKGRR